MLADCKQGKMDIVVDFIFAVNQIFIDFHTLRNLFGDVPTGFDRVTFNIYDPAQLNNIISEVNNLSAIDWQAFNVTTNNETYLEAAAPLQLQLLFFRQESLHSP